MSALGLGLPPTLRAALQAEARRAAPNEVCGVLGGVWRGRLCYAQRHVAIPNASPTPHSHFLMPQAAIVAAAAALQRARCQLIGVYHSHPYAPPVPSPVDLAECTWEATPYLIIGYAATQPSFAAWLIEAATCTHLALI
ncbi:MAG: Mov34/MPN/PAD-1 family protein [Aggregatilineales bacterium]